MASSLQVALRRVCGQTKEETPSRSPKACQREKTYGSEAHATACLAAPSAACVGWTKGSQASVVATVAFDGGSRRCSVDARARVGPTCTCVCVKPQMSIGKVPDPERSLSQILPHPHLPPLFPGATPGQVSLPCTA